MSVSGASALLVEEGLRMDAHPGVLFRDGPAGRRAVVIGGPDVREVVRAIRSAAAEGPDLDEQGVLTLVSVTTGLSPRMLRVAVDYYAAYPEEVDLMLRAAEEAERSAQQVLEVGACGGQSTSA
jgi:DNA-binding transcriptional LysR family regulator